MLLNFIFGNCKVLQTVSQLVSLLELGILCTCNSSGVLRKYPLALMATMMMMATKSMPMNRVVDWNDEKTDERRINIVALCKCEPEGKQLLTDPEINSQMRPDNRHTTNTHSTQHPVRYVRDYLPVCVCVYILYIHNVTEWVLNDDVSMCSVDSIYKLIGAKAKKERVSEPASQYARHTKKQR